MAASVAEPPVGAVWKILSVKGVVAEPWKPPSVVSRKSPKFAFENPLGPISMLFVVALYVSVAEPVPPVNVIVLPDPSNAPAVVKLTIGAALAVAVIPTTKSAAAAARLTIVAKRLTIISLFLP
jgi:hypothetical protein